MPLSGGTWVAQFPTSSRLQDLVQPFRDNVTRFVDSLSAGGASVRVSATLRPPERAYLMHYSWRIFRENMDPARVPTMPGVDIEWMHPTPAATRLAAGAMVRGYGTVFRPSLSSRHTEGRAVDMTITHYEGKSFANGSNQTVTVINDDELHALGGTFGVIKLRSDPPHWSDDGR
jgi:hypothetical protein